jgi:hypothetical protein
MLNGLFDSECKSHKGSGQGSCCSKDENPIVKTALSLLSQSMVMKWQKADMTAHIHRTNKFCRKIKPYSDCLIRQLNKISWVVDRAMCPNSKARFQSGNCNKHWKAKHQSQGRKGYAKAVTTPNTRVCKP